MRSWWPVLPQFSRHLRHPVHDPQQIAAPHLRDLLFGVAATRQFDGHVRRFRGAVPPLDAPSTIEVGRNAHVLDADLLDDVVEVIDEILDGCTRGRRIFLIQLGKTFLVLGALLVAELRERRAASAAATSAAAPAAALGQSEFGVELRQRLEPTRRG